MTEQTSGKQGGKGQQKYGRHARSGAAAAYKATNRKAINAAKRVAKQAKAIAKAVARKLTTLPCGTARALRRVDLLVFKAIRALKEKATKAAQHEH